MNNVINLVLVLAVLALVGLGCGGSKSAATTSTGNAPVAADPAKPAAPAEKPIAIDAKALTKEYDDNELAADGKYKAKQLVVTGRIHDIAETFGNVTVQLDGYKEYGLDVMCSFEDTERDAIAKLKKGDKVTFTGTADGKTASLYVGLEKCKVQK